MIMGFNACIAEGDRLYTTYTCIPLPLMVGR